MVNNWCNSKTELQMPVEILNDLNCLSYPNFQ